MPFGRSIRRDWRLVKSDFGLLKISPTSPAGLQVQIGSYDRLPPILYQTPDVGKDSLSCCEAVRFSGGMSQVMSRPCHSPGSPATGTMESAKSRIWPVRSVPHSSDSQGRTPSARQLPDTGRWFCVSPISQRTGTL